ATHAGQVHAIQQHGPLGRRDRHACLSLLRCREPERACFEPLVPQAQPVAVPVQELHPISPAIAEHEQMARERVLLQHVLHHRGQPVEAPPEVCRLEADEDLDLTGYAQHGPGSSAASTPRSVCGATPSGTRSTTPSGSTTSTHAAAMETLTGTNCGR